MNDSTARQQLIIESEMEGFQEGYDYGKKVKWTERSFTVFFSILVGVCLGYFWAYQVYLTDNTHAEKDLNKLENEFHESVIPQKAHSFHIFNGQFEIWPVNLAQKMFYYRKIQK